MTLHHLIARLLGRRGEPPRPPCRLSEAEVLDIAAQAIGARQPMRVLDAVQIGDRVEWHIGTATVGSGTMVRIDDATGQIVERRRWGIR